jgi:hypothetical protein
MELIEAHSHIYCISSLQVVENKLVSKTRKKQRRCGRGKLMTAAACLCEDVPAPASPTLRCQEYVQTAIDETNRNDGSMLYVEVPRKTEEPLSFPTSVNAALLHSAAAQYKQVGVVPGADDSGGLTCRRVKRSRPPAGSA